MPYDGSTSEAVAQLFFENVWRLHDMPMKIICDRDSRFQADFWKELARLIGLKMGATTPYHPAGDGQAENTNSGDYVASME